MELKMLSLSILQESIVLGEVKELNYKEYSLEDYQAFNSSVIDVIEELGKESKKIPTTLFNIKVTYEDNYKKLEQTNEKKSVQFSMICKLLAYLQYGYSNKLEKFKNLEERIEKIENEEVKAYLKDESPSWIYNLKLPVVMYYQS